MTMNIYKILGDVIYSNQLICDTLKMYHWVKAKCLSLVGVNILQSMNI